MANTITGKIHKIYPTERKEINGKVYHERILVIDNTRYDQYTGEPGFSSFPSFSINGDEKCRELDSFVEGEVVTVSFDIQGLKYNDKNTGEMTLAIERFRDWASQEAGIYLPEPHETEMLEQIEIEIKKHERYL